MTRRKIREEIFKALFQAEFHSEEEMPEQVDRFIEDEEPPIIDKELNRVAEGWTTARMPKVDLTLLRLALYEIRYEELPAGVAINEAVELAKKYGSDNSSSFINGVLGRIVRE